MQKHTILLFCILMVSFTSFAQKKKDQIKLYPKLTTYLDTLSNNFNTIPTERKVQLKKLAAYLNTKLQSEKKASIVFICTHNSRRSHMGQLWASAAAEYYGIKGVSNYSGGTEMTAFNERAVKALVKAGFVITKTSEDANAKYETKYGETLPVIMSFSKKYTDEPNPTSNFAAIMTCSQADKNCPIVYGAAARIAVPYDDPKEADGKPNETATYDERCKQIATEVLYTFSLVKVKK